MMFHLLLIPLVSLAVTSAEASRGIIYAAAPAERGAYHIGGRKTYNYGYNTGDGTAKVEVRHPDGSVTGSYRYYDPLGRQIIRSYTADKRGFRVLGNDLPSNPHSPALGFLDSQTLTGAVEGTNDEFSTLTLSNPPNDDLVLTNSQNIVSYQSKRPEQVRQTKSTHATRERANIQQSILEKQRQLAELRAKQKRLEKAADRIRNVQRESNSLKQQSDFSTHFTSLNAASGGNYFFSDDNINYDFPAGFAYNLVPVFNPVGVKGFEDDNSVTAGHTVNARHSHAPVAPYSGLQSWLPQRSSNIVYSTNYRTDRQPYVIGHYK